AVRLTPEASTACTERQSGRWFGRAPGQRGERYFPPWRPRFPRADLRRRAREAAHLRAELAQLGGALQGDHAASSAPNAATSRVQMAPAPISAHEGAAARSRRGATTVAPVARAASAHCSTPSDASDRTANAPPACIP